jgi:hypothetical protein
MWVSGWRLAVRPRARARKVMWHRLRGQVLTVVVPSVLVHIFDSASPQILEDEDDDDENDWALSEPKNLLT